MKNGNKNNYEQGKSEGSWVNEVVRAGVMSTTDHTNTHKTYKCHTCAMTA